MSTSQRLTLIGLYNYDSTLFDNLSLPTGYDNDTFIESLLLEHGEKCVLYSNPTFLKSAIGTWSNKWNLELTRIYESLTAEYDPIYNYDRYESYTDTESITDNGTSESGHTAVDSPNMTNIQTNDFTITNSQTTSTENEHLISADNSSDYNPDSKDINNAGVTESANSGTITNVNSGTAQNLTESANETTTDTRARELGHTAHIYGNIGVTTSAQMVTEVVEQRLKYNLYDLAINLFASELLINVY